MIAVQIKKAHKLLCNVCSLFLDKGYRVINENWNEVDGLVRHSIPNPKDFNKIQNGVFNFEKGSPLDKYEMQELKSEVESTLGGDSISLEVFNESSGVIAFFYTPYTITSVKKWVEDMENDLGLKEGSLKTKLHYGASLQMYLGKVTVEHKSVSEEDLKFLLENAPFYLCGGPDNQRSFYPLDGRLYSFDLKM